MNRVTKDEILERLVFSDGLIEAYARPEHDDRAEPACDHWPGPVLLERVAYLRKLAHFSEGSASDTIREFESYSISLMTLVRSGDAVAHEKHGRTFLVLDGQATLVSGGVVDHGRTMADGEVRGTAITGGLSRELRRGDVVHVAAGIAHQFQIAGEKSFSCLLILVKEHEDASARSGQVPVTP